MPETMAARIEALRALSVPELRERYREAFDGKEAPSANKDFLWRRIAWRIQEKELGGLGPEARARLEELQSAPEPQPAPPAAEAPPPEPGGIKDRRLPSSGTLLRRAYKGRMIEVKVTDAGFEYEGRPVRSLSAVAKEVTGAHWNGFLFFNL